MDIVCSRCNRKLNEMHYLLQIMVYLGDSNPRQPLCNNCYRDFVSWFDEGAKKEE